MESRYRYFWVKISALDAYVLNFKGRVVKPSVKNFQLIDPADGNIKHL
jgi:hypothetical protein